MDAAKLNAMTLAELRREAVERGIPRATRLGREALIERLLAAREPARPSSKRPAPPRARAAASEKKREPSERGEREKSPRRAAPAATKPAASKGSVTSRGRGERPTVPSTTPPDRPYEQEPQTMARLYLEQGEPERAAEIYRELLAVTPDDKDLRARLAAAEEAIARRAGEKHVEPPPPPPRPSGEPFGMLDFEELPEAYGVDECEVIAKDPHHVFVYWEVTEGAVAGARAQIESTGAEAAAARLVLRLFTLNEPGEPGPGRDSRDYPLDWNHGRRYVPVGHPGSRVRAAVGLLAPSGLFVPITQSSPLRVPPAEPAPPGPVEWMEVVPGRSGGRRAEPIEIVRGRAGGERGVFPGGPSTEPRTGTSPWRWRGGPGQPGSGSG